VKLWRLMERNKRLEGLNLHDNSGVKRDPTSITSLRVPTFVPTDSVVHATARRTFANAHAYHINSLSVNSDQETFLSADDLRVNLWHISVGNQSFSILDLLRPLHTPPCNFPVDGESANLLRTCCGLVKPCPHCRKKVRLSQKTATVAEFSFSATVWTGL